MAPKVQLICPTCGSTDIVKDAAAVWNVDSQAWELLSEYDSETCNACGREGDGFADRVPIE